MKFGGGCLKNKKQIGQIVRIIKSERTPPAVVFSAVHGITDSLIQAMTDAKGSPDSVRKSVQEISETHIRLAAQTIRNKNILTSLQNETEKLTERLEKLLLGISYTGEIGRPVHARVVSYGERFAVHLMSGCLKDAGIPHTLYETDRIGMVTDEQFDNATVDLELFRKNFSSVVLQIRKNKHVSLFTGFFGCSLSGKVTTFGRNGSDYSAAVIAYAFDACELELWKDVDGFMSADPRIIVTAKRIMNVSYHEAAELSYFGAKILHPRSLEPVHSLPITVRLKSLIRPGNKGTLITNKSRRNRHVIKSVTDNRSIAVLRIEGPGVGYIGGLIGKIGDALHHQAINIISVITSQTSINILIDERVSVNAYTVIKGFENGVIEKVTLLSRLSLIGVVGNGMNSTPGIAARMFNAVSRAGVNVEMICSGASDVAAYFIVRRHVTDRALKAIHSEFFGRRRSNGIRKSRGN